MLNEDFYFKPYEWKEVVWFHNIYHLCGKNEWRQYFGHVVKCEKRKWVHFMEIIGFVADDKYICTSNSTQVFYFGGSSIVFTSYKLLQWYFLLNSMVNWAELYSLLTYQGTYSIYRLFCTFLHWDGISLSTCFKWVLGSVSIYFPGLLFCNIVYFSGLFSQIFKYNLMYHTRE